MTAAVPMEELPPAELPPAAIPANFTRRAFVVPPPPPPPDAKRKRTDSSPSLVPVSPASPSTGSSSNANSEPEIITEWWTQDTPEADEGRRCAIQELKSYLDEWNGADKDAFWHRRSGKAVLSVVVCRSRRGGLVTYRGMNTEVSLPAGSLCAERAAIAQAAAALQHASDILAIATADPKDKLNPLWPCEVCQSWLAKLRPQSPSIAVLAVATSACENFAVRVNGDLHPPPLPPALPSPQLACSTPWPELVERAEGDKEWPWEARELVYVDGAWTFLHCAQQSILRIARSRGTHLLVGVHSDDVLLREFDGPVLESFATRLGRVRENRHVDSVLKDAPWELTTDLITSLGIHRVVTGSIGKSQDVGKGREGEQNDPYRVARELGILEVVPSADETTEWKVHEKSVALSRP